MPQEATPQRRSHPLIGCGCLLLLAVLAAVGFGAWAFRGDLRPALTGVWSWLQEGRTRPPAARARVLERRATTLGPGGGELALADGTRIVVPAGALAGDVEFGLARLDPVPFQTEPLWWTAALDITAPVERFAVPVEVRLVLPPEAASAPADDILCGWVDATTGARHMLPVRREVVGDRVEAVFSVSHFSLFVLELMLGEAPPATAGPWTVPIYRQGQTKFCWAAGLQMVTRAASDRQGTLFDVIGRVGREATSVDPVAMQFDQAIGDLVEERCQVRPDRRIWDYGIYGSFDPLLVDMREYLKHRLGLNRSPVLIGSSWREHAFVLVGYDADGRFHVHDPRQPPDYAAGLRQSERAGYYLLTEQLMGTGWLLPGSSVTTLYVPRRMTDGRPTVTVNVPSGAVFLAKHGSGTDPFAADIKPGSVLRWDHTRPEGYSWSREKAMDDTADYRWWHAGDPAAPGGDAEVGLEVINSAPEGQGARRVTLDLRLASGGRRGPVVYRQQWPLDVPANRAHYVSFAVDTGTFHNWDAGVGQTYSCLIRILDGDTTLDQAEFDVPLGPGRREQAPAPATAKWFLAGVKAAEVRPSGTDIDEMRSEDGALSARVVGPSPDAGQKYEYRVRQVWTSPPAELKPLDTLVINLHVSRTWVREAPGLDRNTLGAGLLTVGTPSQRKTVREGEDRWVLKVPFGQPGERMVIDVAAVPMSFFWPHWTYRYTYIYGGKDLPEPRLPVGTNPRR